MLYHLAIKDAAAFSGVKAHTLRLWEQRYPHLVPHRNAGRHRSYTHGDLKKLLRVALLYKQGWKPARLAGLSAHHLDDAVQQLKDGPATEAYHVLQLLEAALDIDKAGFATQLETAIGAMGFEACLVRVCHPMMQAMVWLWRTSRRVQEPFYSYIIQHKIIAETDKLPKPSDAAPEILLFSPHGTHHHLALHFIHYLLQQGGWTTLFLGADVNQAALQPFAARPCLTHVFVHVSVDFTGLGLDDYFEALCRLFRGKTVVASGMAVALLQRRFTNLQLLYSDAGIQAFAAKKPGYLGVT